MNTKTFALLGLLVVGMVAAAPAASAEVVAPAPAAGPCELHAVIDLDNKTVDFSSILSCISSLTS
jgi:hypothetical protein